MYFERLLLTNKYEIYRFSREIEVITYLVFEDTFSKAGQAFGDAIYDQCQTGKYLPCGSCDPGSDPLLYHSSCNGLFPAGISKI